MTDISTIGAALGAIKSAADIAKLIKDSGASLEQAEVKLKIAELISSLADAKIELAEVQVQLSNKDKEIESLQERLSVKNTVVWEKPYYWVVKESEKDGPFCQQCYDNEQKLIRLQGGGTKAWVCKTCKATVTDSNFVRPRI
ncbi:MAG: hypothetical protein WC256_07720 [Desulfurivibrionaceae bacterium]|jgi:hypothetical protein